MTGNARYALLVLSDWLITELNKDETHRETRLCSGVSRPRVP